MVIAYAAGKGGGEASSKGGGGKAGGGRKAARQGSAGQGSCGGQAQDGSRQAQACRCSRQHLCFRVFAISSSGLNILSVTPTCRQGSDPFLVPMSDCLQCQNLLFVSVACNYTHYTCCNPSSCVQHGRLGGGGSVTSAGAKGATIHASFAPLPGRSNCLHELSMAFPRRPVTYRNCHPCHDPQVCAAC